MNYIVEYYKRYNKVPVIGKFQFADTFEIVMNLPPDEAIEYLKKRGSNIKLTKTSKDNPMGDDSDLTLSEAHDKAFTVANIMNADIVQDVLNTLVNAKENGTTYEEWSDDMINSGLVNKMQESGWTGKNKNRLAVIWNTNMQTSFGKGRYKQLKSVANEFPLWKYVQVQRASKRHSHAQYHGKYYRHDDPIWDYITPPSGYGCQCQVIPYEDSGEYEVEAIDEDANYEEPQINPNQAWKPTYEKYNDKVVNALKAIFGKE